MADPLATQVVDAVLDRLADIPYLRARERAAASLDRGTWSPDEMQAAINRLHGRTPAVLVSLDEWRDGVGSIGGYTQNWRIEVDVNVYIVNDYRGSLTDGRLDPSDAADADASADQGQRRLAEDAFSRLAGWSPAVCVGRLDFVGLKTTMVDAGHTIAEMRFTTDLSLTSTPLVAREVFDLVHVDNVDPDQPSIIITTEDLT